MPTSMALIVIYLMTKLKSVPTQHLQRQFFGNLIWIANRTHLLNIHIFNKCIIYKFLS